MNAAAAAAFAIVTFVSAAEPAPSAQAPPPPPPPQQQQQQQQRTLSAAYQREIALLEAEKSALTAALAKVHEQRATRAAEERKALARLEAAVVGARAQNDASAVRVASLERSGAVDVAGLEPAVASMRRALVTEGVGGVAGERDLAALLATAGRDIERGAQVTRMESGFFAADGRYVSGVVVDVGRVASVGAARQAAGPLVTSGDDVKQVFDDGYDAAARAFVDGAGPAPLRLAPPAALAAAAADEPVSPWTPLGAAGAAGAVGVALAALARLLWLRRSRKQAADLIARAPLLVEIGDVSAAEALCRSTPGPAGNLISTIVEASTQAGGAKLDDDAGDAWLDAAGAVDRGERVLAAAAVGALVVTALGAARSSTFGGLPVELALAAAALPALAFLTLARGEAEQLKRDLERGALKLVDAARRNRTP